MLKELGISDPKKFGGVLGALNRWAPARGVRLPFSSGRNEDGEKVWTWGA